MGSFTHACNSNTDEPVTASYYMCEFPAFMFEKTLLKYNKSSSTCNLSNCKCKSSVAKLYNMFYEPS